MNCCKLSQCLITYGYIVLIVVSIIPGCISKVTVNWTIATKRIVLGSDLQLECRVKGEDRNESSALKRWTRGSYDHDICTDTKCIKEDKYEMQNDHSKPSFNLTIKNVDETDIKESVTCWYDFESSSGTIISQKDTIVFDQARINKQTSDYMIDGNYLDVYITLDKVFPVVQNCFGTVKYEKFTITLDKGLDTLSFKLPSGLYRAVVNGTLELPQFTTNCSRVLKLTCNFASVPITLFDIKSTQCELQKSEEANSIFVILFAGFLVLSVLMALAFIIFCKYFYTERLYKQCSIKMKNFVKSDRTQVKLNIEEDVELSERLCRRISSIHEDKEDTDLDTESERLCRRISSIHEDKEDTDLGERSMTPVQKEETFEKEMQDCNETNVKKTHGNKRFSKIPRRNRRDRRRYLTLP